MKFTTGKLAQFARAISGQGSARDADFELLAKLAQVIELPEPLQTSNPTFGAIQARTFAYNINFTRGGAGAAGNVDGPTFAPGLWRLSGTLKFQFAGTVNIVSAAAVSLVDPAAVLLPLADITMVQTPILTTWWIDLTFNLVDAGWFLRHQNPATIAGDNLAYSAHLIANRLA